MAESMKDVKDVEKQLKKEKKEKEKQEREKEKREKKLEKERKKQEAKDQKQREKEAKQKTQNGASSHNAEPTEEPSKNMEGLPQNGLRADGYGSPELPKDEHFRLPNEAETAVASLSKPEEVTVAEPPGQNSGCGQPIGIVFDTTRAGKGPLTASCTGAKIGNVQTTVTEVREGIFSVKFTPDVADVYVLSVRWGGKEVNGSPFNINLDRLPQTEKEGQGGREEENEEEEEVSDDPFEMAIQARKLLGEYST